MNQSPFENIMREGIEETFGKSVKEIENIIIASQILKSSLQFALEADLIGGPIQLKYDIERAYKLLIEKP